MVEQLNNQEFEISFESSHSYKIWIKFQKDKKHSFIVLEEKNGKVLATTSLENDSQLPKLGAWLLELINSKNVVGIKSLTKGKKTSQGILSGSASHLGWINNIPLVASEHKLNYSWNTDLVKIPSAIKELNNKLDSRLISNRSVVVQFDTGWSDHPMLIANKNYKRDLSIDYVNPKRNGSDKLRSFKKIIKQLPGHGTSTAYTFVGLKGKNANLFPIVVDDNRLKGYLGNCFETPMSSGLYPEAIFIPMRLADRVVLALNFFEKNTLDVQNAVEKVISDPPGERSVDVITMSMGNESPIVSLINGEKLQKIRNFVSYLSKLSAPLKHAAEHAYKNGVIFVAAAGNSIFLDEKIGPVLPASDPHTIGVAGLEPRRDPETTQTEFWPWKRGVGENLSNEIDEIDISGPAKYVYTAFMPKEYLEDDELKVRFPNGLFKFGGATSQATVHVAAAAAIWKDYWRAEIEDEETTYSIHKHLIVEAFKWALRASRFVPEYWKSHKDPKGRSPEERNIGILNTKALISKKLSPLIFLDLLEEHNIPLDFKKRREIFNKRKELAEEGRNSLFENGEIS